MRLVRATLLASLFALAACAQFSPRDPLRVDVAGIEQMPGEGLEIVLAVRLRVQNPNNTPLDYDGVAVELDVNGRSFASGVSDEVGTVPRFGETIITIPVTISAFDVARQIYGAMTAERPDEIRYHLSGKLAGGLFGTRRFEDEGMFTLAPPPRSELN